MEQNKEKENRPTEQSEGADQAVLGEVCLSVYVEFDDGDIRLLPDISFEKFEELLWTEGANDTEYDKYLRENNMQEICDFNESILEGTLVFKNNCSGRELRFKCIYDSENTQTNFA